MRGIIWNYLDMPSYTIRLELIKLPTLRRRRTMLISCVFLLRSVEFNIPCHNFRCYNLIYTQFCRSNYAVDELLTRICSQFYLIICQNSCVIKRNNTVFLNSLLYFCSQFITFHIFIVTITCIFRKNYW